MSIKKLLIVLLLLAGLVSTVQALSPVEEAKLIASDWEAWDEFGFSVAISGDTAVVGSYYRDSGAAYIYERTRAGWVETAKLTASDAVRWEYFGYSVAISGDTAVIGASEDDDLGVLSGSAYIFQRTRNGWEEVAKLLASDGESYDYFGHSVAISGDTVVVSSFSGAAYIFQCNASNWTEVAKLTPSDGNFSGWSVDISEDTIIVGGNDSAYIFRRTFAGWTETARLTPSNPASTYQSSVAIDKNTAVVGAPGGAYVFERHGTTWTEVARLAHNGSIATDGNVIVIGMLYGEAAYVFQRFGSNWTEVATLTPSDAGVVGPFNYVAKWFGNAVAISDDTVVVGARYDSVLYIDVGAAYVFRLR